MANTFNKKNKSQGRKTAINSIIWARNQPGGIIKMVDDFVNLLNAEHFLIKRKGTLKYVVGAGPGCEPTFVYKANEIYKFETDGEILVKFLQRPGWNGLQSPGDIIILSFQIDESSRLVRGFVIHRDPSLIGVNPGVISQEESNPCLNSYFFTALFEAYWCGQPAANNFIGIFHSNKPKDNMAFLIHISENNKKTYLNYCPKTNEVKNTMDAAIPLLTSLMPYVPRSIIVKNDVPLCAVEVVSYGTSFQYGTNIYLIDDPTKPKPIPYSVNKNLLEYAWRKIKELGATHPSVRFSTTGEGVFYKFNGGRQVDLNHGYPSANPYSKCVFENWQTSHLLFLVDNGYGDKPTGATQLEWLPTTGAVSGVLATDDTNEIQLMVDVSTKILNGLGFAKRSNDVFCVTLNGGFPTVGEGEIPATLRNHVEYVESEGKSIKQGVHALIQHFTKAYSE